MITTHPKIVIIGGGAGGLELATQLGHKLGKKKHADILQILLPMHSTIFALAHSIYSIHKYQLTEHLVAPYAHLMSSTYKPHNALTGKN